MKKLLLLVLIFGFGSLSLMLGGCSSLNGSGEGSGQNTLSLTVSPESVSLFIGVTKQFSAEAVVSNIATAVTPSWEVLGGIGTIDSTGIFTATKVGVGTIEAVFGGGKGLSTVVVAARSLSGFVLDALNNNSPISDALVIVGNNSTHSGSGGSFRIDNVPPESNEISFALKNKRATTILTTADSVTLYKFWGETVDWTNTKKTAVKGHLLDASGQPISINSALDSQIIFYNPKQKSTSSYSPGVYNLATDGAFLSQLDVNLYEESITGFISVLYTLTNEAGAKKTYGAVKYFSGNIGDDIDIGDIVLSKEAVPVYVKTNPPANGVSISLYSGISFGGVDYSFGDLGNEGIQENGEYLYLLPATINGAKSFLSLYAQTALNNEWKISSNSIRDLDLSSGHTFSFDIEPTDLVIITAPLQSEQSAERDFTIQWNSLGSGFYYYVVIMNHDNGDLDWLGFTDGNSIKRKLFAGNSEVESLNILDGDYVCYVIAIKPESYDLSNLNLRSQHFLKTSQSQGVLFSVANQQVQLNSFRSLSISDLNKYRERENQLLKRIGMGSYLK